jgi:hypothetical protein
VTQDKDIHQKRKGRNFSVGLLLGGFVVLVFAVTVVKLAQGTNYRGTERVPGITPTVVSE